MSKKLAVALAAGLGLSASLATGAGAEALKIGIIGPLTGGGAPWGIAAAEGVKILASEVNAKGGLDVGGKKYQIEIVAYDDQYKAADAVAAYNRLLNVDGAKYVMTVTSPAALALGESVESDKVVMLTSAGVEKAVDPKSRYMFRMLSLLRDYVPPMVGWIKDNVPGKRVVVLNPNDESGWNSNRIAVESYKKHGFDVAGTELYERSQKDFQPLLTKVLGVKPDLIELASSPPATAGLIVRQARELGFKGTFVKNSGAATKEIVAAAGKDGAEGVISLHFANPFSEGFKRLSATYSKTIGQSPDDLIVIYYDAANVLLNAIQKAGDVNDTKKVSDTLLTKPLPNSIQGDELALGGRGGPGDENQIMTFSYISVMKNGEPAIVGKVK